MEKMPLLGLLWGSHELAYDNKWLACWRHLMMAASFSTPRCGHVASGFLLWLSGTLPRGPSSFKPLRFYEVRNRSSWVPTHRIFIAWVEIKAPAIIWENWLSDVFGVLFCFFLLTHTFLSSERNEKTDIFWEEIILTHETEQHKYKVALHILKRVGSKICGKDFKTLNVPLGLSE